MTPPNAFTNPVIPGFHPDPSVCRVGDDYWLAVSSFEYFPGVPIFHSRDLVNWELKGHAIDRPSQLDLSGRAASEGIFAPTLRYHDGRFYLITTDVGGIGNFILTTTDPAGEWSEPIRVSEGDAFNWFDPSLCFDADGTVYYTRRQDFHIVQAEIDPLTGKLLTPLRKIHERFTSDDIEGPHLYRIGDWYYLMCAEGGTAWGHALSIGRARTAWGPFEACPANPILTHRHLVNHSIRYTGHGDFVQAQDGTWWLLFLATRHAPGNGSAFHHLGRETFLAPVHWESGWPVINNGEIIQPLTEGPALPRAFAPPRELPRDTFDAPELSPRWVYRRQPQPEACRLESGRGLCLYGLPATLSDNAPLCFVGQRLEQPHFTVRTTLDFGPHMDGEEAGLCLYMAEDFHLSLAVRQEGGQRQMIVRRRAADLEAVVYCEAIATTDAPLILQIEGDWAQFSLAFVQGEGSARTIAQADRRLLCTEVATGWTGLFAGLYATGNGRTATSPARFAWFEHQTQA